MQVFFATVGANASIAAVISSCPALFIFCFVQIAIHLVVTLGIGNAFGFSRRDLLLASNANVGGTALLADHNSACMCTCASMPQLTRAKTFCHYIKQQFHQLMYACACVPS